tara:strand:- start:179 stop:778 length:600 start_codon:yes stop_codon:yes gene_type:complete
MVSSEKILDGEFYKMRIIGGKFKGKKIEYIKSPSTRPIRDMVKENIFNIIEHSKIIKKKVKDSSILDLYSGIGSFGIECVSRGARKVSFVEKSTQALKILKYNINRLNIGNYSTIHNTTVSDFIEKNQYKHQIIFADPPYSDDSYMDHLEELYVSKFYDENNLIIIHREKNKTENLGKFIKIIKMVTYGRSKVLFGILD